MVIVPIILGLLPSFAWLTFYLHEDFRHPEPRTLVALTFILGGVSTFLVLPVQLLLNQFLQQNSIDTLSFAAFILAASIEELFKFGMVFMFVRRTEPFKFEPIQPMIYMITAALGFAAVENIATLIRTSDGTLLNTVLLETLILRFIGATLLHSLASGLVGYYWGKAMALKRSPALFIAVGLVLATALHAMFNFLIINTGPLQITIPFLIVAAFLILNDFEILKQYEKP